jgi:hypothetical protein
VSRSGVADLVSALRDALLLRTASGQRFAALLGRGEPAAGTASSASPTTWTC